MCSILYDQLCLFLWPSLETRVWGRNPKQWWRIMWSPSHFLHGVIYKRQRPQQGSRQLNAPYFFFISFIFISWSKFSPIYILLLRCDLQMTVPATNKLLYKFHLFFSLTYNLLSFFHRLFIFLYSSKFSPFSSRFCGVVCKRQCPLRRSPYFPCFSFFFLFFSLFRCPCSVDPSLSSLSM